MSLTVNNFQGQFIHTCRIFFFIFSLMSCVFACASALRHTHVWCVELNNVHLRHWQEVLVFHLLFLFIAIEKSIHFEATLDETERATSKVNVHKTQPINAIKKPID